MGSELIWRNGTDRVMSRARLPFILLSAALGLLIYLWGRQLVGEVAGLAALFLYALDPTLLAHSAVLLLPVAAALLLAAVHLCGGREPGSPEGNALRGYAAGAGAFLAMCLVAMLAIQALYLSPDGLFLYSTGLQWVNADHDPEYLVFLGGQLRQHFTSYFAVAYLLKEPIAVLLLAGVGLVALARSEAVSALAKLFLLLPPIVLFAAHMMWADNLGVRYIIPVLPFACLIGGAGAVWLIVAAVGIYPDHLSYFNEAACLPGNASRIGIDGGTRCGPLWLDDSNVDWGQGLKQLKAWLDGHAKGRSIRLAYLGTFPPEAYGLAHEKIWVDQLMEEPKPGLYVVSAHLVARVPALADKFKPGAGAWLRRTPPAAIVGHSLYVYDMKDRGSTASIGKD